MDLFYTQKFDVQLSESEERKYLTDYQKNGCKAAFLMLTRSQFKMVRNMVKRMSGYRMDCSDLFQNGICGVIKGINSFQFSFEVKLATYCIQKVKSEINTFIMKNFGIANSVTTKEQRKCFYKVRSLKDFSTDHMSEAEAKRISAILDVNTDTVKTMYHRLTTPSVSTNKSVKEGDNTELFEDSLTYIDQKSPEQIVELQEEADQLSRKLNKALSALPDRQRQVIEERFLNEEKVTLKDLSAEFGVKWQRVQQIEKEALQRLKRSMNVESF